MSKLNKDILFLTFEELQDDSKSLFSCLMVNRLWCETVIPIIWRNPWCYDINYYNKKYLFAIIISYLSDDIKKSLVKQLKHLPSISWKSLVFDYLSFCRSININIIKYIISTGLSSATNRLLLQEEFYGLFMRKCPELKYLDIRSIENQIFHFPEAKLRFELLYELKCNTSDDPLYFYELARISHYIRRLIIFNKTYTKANTGIIKLIEVQKDLKFFEWIDEFYRCNPDYSNYNSRESYKEIFLALGKKADNINHLKIYFANNADRTLQKVLSKFHKLKTLIINDFKYFNEELLRMCIYHDLEIFKIDCYNLKAASIIIENSGGHLKKILLGSYNFNYNHISNFNDDSLTFIRRIYENCPLVEYLSLVFPPSREHFNEFEKLLKICKNLKSILLIICEVTEEDSLVNEDELLKILIRSSPISLREIRFLYDFKFSLEILEEFLEKWKGHALSIFTCKPIYEENYIKLINKYMNNRIIKDFRCESSMNVIKQGLSYEYYVLPYLL